MSFLSRANVHAFHENLTVYILNSHLLTLKAQNHKMFFVVHLTIWSLIDKRSRSSLILVHNVCLPAYVR